MSLNTTWFLLIAVLWVGYFILEGFDFGVGMLLKTVAKTQAERRTLITALGPVWDGNEVWLLVAGGATFAAFPEWYATLFSGFYLPLFLILISLIVRGVSFEYRSKHGDTKWRNNAQTLGPSRFSTGVQNAKPSYQQGFQKFHSVIASTTLPPRGPKGSPENLNRVSALTQALHSAKMAG